VIPPSPIAAARNPNADSQDLEREEHGDRTERDQRGVDDGTPRQQHAEHFVPGKPLRADHYVLDEAGLRTGDARGLRDEQS
jgi:hypothetical protein